MITQLLRPYGGEDDGRIRLIGQDVSIDDRSATPLALFFHELATNAAKYGSLSVADGGVELAIYPAEECALTWRETGGPAVQKPLALGFGHRLMELSITRQLGGQLEYDWQADGLVVTARIPRKSLSRD